MNALDALRLAKSDGVKVRPVNNEIIIDFRYYSLRIESFQGRLYLLVGDERFGRAVELPEYLLINNDGSFVEWEIIQ